MTTKTNNIPFYLLVAIDSLHLMKMHSLNLFVKDETLHQPLKLLADESTDYTKKLTEFTFQFIDAFSTMVYKPFKK